MIIEPSKMKVLKCLLISTQILNLNQQQYKHIRQKRALSLKQVSKCTVERDTPRIIKLRFNIITNWTSAGVNFHENCVSVDKWLSCSINKRPCLVKSWRSSNSKVVLKRMNDNIPYKQVCRTSDGCSG
ncbi:hypothetical protein CLU79DRAFT_189473 [Phycomyces nitens]|nr:hypothetical protein CLU79DRAFT_189473 [Phycomyces nitens]